MNLWSMTWFAYMAQQVDVDLWNYSTFNFQGQRVLQRNTYLNKVTLMKGRVLMPGIYIMTISGAINAQEKFVIQ